MGEFYLTPDQRAKITVDELLLHVVAVLQRNTRTPGANRIGYYPTQLSSIKGFELSTQSEGRDQRFEEKFAQVKQLLYSKNYVFRDPTQSHDDFVKLTDAGLALDPTQTIVGITPLSTFIRDMEANLGVLDATCRQYLEESYRAAESGLWLSCAFMLGGASERLIMLLSEHVDSLLNDPIESAKLAREWQVRKIKEWTVDQLPALKRKYQQDSEAFKDVEDKFDTLVALYRYERNDAGHPKDSPYVPDIAALKAMLLGFSTFAKAVMRILAISPTP